MSRRWAAIDEAMREVERLHNAVAFGNASYDDYETKDEKGRRKTVKGVRPFIQSLLRNAGLMGPVDEEFGADWSQFQAIKANPFQPLTTVVGNWPDGREMTWYESLVEYELKPRLRAALVRIRRSA